MDYFYNWIKQIVLFILIGTVLEMLLPSNHLRKYVHFVFGLLFLLLLAKPIFYLFQVNVLEDMAMIEQRLNLENGRVNEASLLIEKQKKDIQAEQVAYIWNELTNFYIEAGNEALLADAIQITHIDFDGKINGLEQFDSISHVTVTIESYEEADVTKIDPVEQIDIKVSKTKAASTDQVKESYIEQKLRDIWQIDDSVSIDILWEGGAS